VNIAADERRPVLSLLREALSACVSSLDPSRAFASMARTLLHGCVLSLGPAPFRLIEVEFYRTTEGHEDPYTHCDPRQSRWGEWYFHRAGGTLRNGTFKGVDLTLGSESMGAFAVLLRGAASLDGARVLDGPCVFVDAAIALTGSSSIAALAALAEGPSVEPSPGSTAAISLSACDVREGTLLSSARVGLRLGPAASSRRAHFCAARYRFTSEPRLVKKGRAELVCALVAEGARVEEISRTTGSPLATVRSYADAFSRGLAGERAVHGQTALARCYELGLASRLAASAARRSIAAPYRPVGHRAVGRTRP
jgi:hypothetical protein